uniref:Uncharacterized protein n=1 Tax=Arundo donax TaxID=35708 RepID=A0A0A9HND3_ARUDO
MLLRTFIPASKRKYYPLFRCALSVETTAQRLMFQ